MRRVWKNLSVLAGGIVFSLLIGLLVLAVADFLIFSVFLPRISSHTQDYLRIDPELGWVPLANKTTYWANSWVSGSNSLGFRGDELDSTREHVLVLGDSVAYGAGVADNESLPYYLDRLIGEERSGLQALNLGVVGYSLDQYYLYLMRNINLTRPKLIVVVIYTWNDYSDTIHDNSEFSKPFFVLKEGQLVNLNQDISEYSCINVLSRSGILRRLDPMRKIGGIVCGEKELSTDAEKKEVIKRLISEIASIAEGHGSRLLFVLSPSRLDYWDYEEGYGELDDGGWNLRFFQGLMRGSGYDYLDYYEVVEKSGVNASTLYLENEFSHYNAYGNKRLAEAVFRHIKEKGLLD